MSNGGLIEIPSERKRTLGSALTAARRRSNEARFLCSTRRAHSSEDGFLELACRGFLAGRGDTFGALAIGRLGTTGRLITERGLYWITGFAGLKSMGWLIIYLLGNYSVTSTEIGKPLIGISNLV